MVAIEVYRGVGGSRGADIIDPLIGGSTVCALARGRAEMDARAHRRKSVSMEILFRPNLRMGQVIRATDLSGNPWSGMIVGITHRLDAGKALTTLTLDKPEV